MITNATVELHDPDGSLRASLQIEGEDIREIPPGYGLRRDVGGSDVLV